MPILIAAALLQEPVDWMTLEIDAVESAPTMRFDVRGSPDVPDGIRFVLTAYYGEAAVGRHLGSAEAEVRDGALRFDLEVPRMAWLAGTYVFTIRPDRQQPGGLSASTLRELQDWTGEWSRDVGTRQEADEVPKRIRLRLTAEINRTLAAVEALQAEFESCRATGDRAAWEAAVERTHREMAELVEATQLDRRYDLFSLRPLVATAFEDLPAAVRSVAEAQRAVLDGRRDAEATLADRRARHRKLRDEYLRILDAHVRDLDEARGLIDALRRSVSALPPSGDGSIPTEVQRVLLDLSWQFVGDPTGVLELTESVAAYYRGEAGAEPIEAALVKLAGGIPPEQE